ncbi:glutathionylspermidine synthase family protein [Starkeya koreensis]|uniref:Glutathionylspermidine synthase family protein n=1 Tax=Ancylobacter koreensis TaxID=266121 RepID=A0ABT0DHS7_9HYPH|nr:glutathionylspermidine synthase family protein [Ancylobacter koreensis]MCK0206835.1 glutathionylspermidine synthase family protein [Ancylobacter koreensis]
MRRHACAEHPALNALLPTIIEQHSANRDYWGVDHYYELDGEAVETVLSPAAEELWALCLDFVARAVDDERILESLGIPGLAWDAVRASWRRADPLLFARFDLSFDGHTPPKLHECNVDVVGLLYETAVYQANWLRRQQAEARLTASARQMADLEGAAGRMAARRFGDRPVELVSLDDDPYDELWQYTLFRILDGAGIACDVRNYTSLEAFLASLPASAGSAVAPYVVKGFRWDHLIRDSALALHVGALPAGIAAPLWSALLSSKGSLAWLWHFNRGHPNLLASFFEPARLDDADGYVAKPLFSIQGQGIELRDRRAPGRNCVTRAPGPVCGRVYQDLHYLPRPAGPVHANGGAGGPWASTGVWMVEGRAVALGMSECDSPIITDDAMRFVPHVLA